LSIICVDLTNILHKGYSDFCKKVKGIAIISATNRELRLAYVLGITSPNNRIKKVVNKICTKKFTTEFEKSRLLKIKEEMIIIVILIRLLEINIVASNIFGDSISLRIRLCLLILDVSSFFLSVGVNEKNAISEPEIKPEEINNKIQEKKEVKKL